MDNGKSPRFLTFASMTISWETGGDRSGGYTNDPKDRGKETKWGISKAAHPGLNIKGLTFNDALNIYFTQYWYDDLDAINSDLIAYKVYDMGVLMGTTKAQRLLQRAVRDSGKTIAVDGHIGPISVAAINACDETLLYSRYIRRLEKRIKRIALLGANRRFLGGWLRRVFYKFQVVTDE